MTPPSAFSMPPPSHANEAAGPGLSRRDRLGMWVALLKSEGRQASVIIIIPRRGSQPLVDDDGGGSGVALNLYAGPFWAGRDDTLLDGT